MRKLLPFLGILLLVLPFGLSGQVYIWVGGNMTAPGPNAWNNPGNWLSYHMGATYPQLTTDLALFISASPGYPTVQLNSNIEIGSLVVATGYTIDLDNRQLTAHSGNIINSSVTKGVLVHGGSGTLNISGAMLSDIFF